MENNITAKDICWALLTGRYAPDTEDIDWFRFEQYNEFYYAYTGRLPEVYLEKRVAADHFDYGEDLMLLYEALDMVNSQLSPVKAFLAEEDSTVVFRLCLGPKTAGQFKEELPNHLDRLEQSVLEMGQACELAVRRSRMQGADDLMESLMNPTPNNPLLLGKKVS